MYPPQADSLVGFWSCAYGGVVEHQWWVESYLIPAHSVWHTLIGCTAFQEAHYTRGPCVTWRLGKSAHEVPISTSCSAS